MSHRRAQIRAYFVSTLTGLATTGASVSASRVYPYGITGELPSLRIVTGSESREDGVMGGRPYLQGRNLDVIVEARTAGATFSDDLDQIALEVETAIMADPFLGGLAEWCELADTEPDETDDLEDATGLLSLTFAVRYRVDAADPQ